jgi:serine/threonine-protein kinase RsbW
MNTPEAVNEVRFSSLTENIAIVEKLIDEVCEIFHVKEDHYGNILISLTEAVNNAIVHGNRLNPNKNVIVKYSTHDNFIRFWVEDEGPGFDYDNLPDPTSPENREKPNGRGVFLMRNLADQCEFLEDGKIVQLDFAALS